MSEFLAPDNMWLLLDTPSDPALIDDVKEAFPDTHCDELFADTELDCIRAEGPLLMRLNADEQLVLMSDGQINAWPGLFIACPASREVLLAHLRRMLIVRFSDQHKSLLTYYNVQTASYFFDAMDADELSRWMGPAESITWFGGPWADKVDGSQGRQYVVNPKRMVSPLIDEPWLSARQEKKLQQCFLERHAFYWSRTFGHDYRRTLHHLREGLSHGFNDGAILDQWLTLRARFPSASVPPHLQGDSQRERFDSLTNYWQGGM
ncbi:MAG: hypothetical protein JWQ69_604 [Pseudomonas sp.]|nr:hypothetical protein [Pseudomonas sp.]